MKLVYGIYIQFKMDIRSKTLLITCYLVPLLFFLIMGGIFTSLMPEAKETLIQSMTLMGISMGALIGVPPSIFEIYGTTIRKMYQANGIPNYFGLIALIVSAYIHLTIVSLLIVIIAPIIFQAELPENVLLYFFFLSLFLSVSLGVACLLGLSTKNQAQLTMFSQIIFLPSIMLSGIMFSRDLLPSFLWCIGQLLPATWGYQLLLENEIRLSASILFIMLLLVCITIFHLLCRIYKKN